MHTANLAGVRIGYELAGSGDRLVVLVGGTGMPPSAWDAVGFPRALVAAGFTVVTVAARGVRPSDAPPPPYRVEQLAADLAGLIEHLGHFQCDVVGYSLGGFTVEALCQDRPDLVRSAVLLASAGPASAVTRAVTAVETELASSLGFIPACVPRSWEFFTALPPHSLADEETATEWWELLGAAADCWTSADGALGQSSAACAWINDPGRMDRLTQIEIPVLVACFEHDLLFSPQGGRTAASRLPNGSFIELRAAAHGGLITHPQQCLGAVLSHLDAT